MEARSPWPRRLIATWLTLIVGLLLFGAAMDRDLNHDEHQFLAPGALVARGLLPYRDFAIFHLPNLSFLYGALDRLTKQPILSAKLVGVCASTGLSLLLFLAATRHLANFQTRRLHYWLAVASMVLLLGDQLFVFTTGKTWNHEFPAFLLIAGLVCQVHAVENQRLGWLLPSGLCIGLAVGTRLTYAPVVAVFPLMLFVTPLPVRSCWNGGVLWVLGCLLGLGPSLYFLLAHQDQFLFDNLRFPRLRLLDIADTRVQKTSIWWRKLRFFGKEILLHSLPLLLSAGLAFFQPLREWLKNRQPNRYGVALAFALLPAILVGCFLPSRYQYQHYYAIAPLLAILLAYSIRTMEFGSSKAVVLAGIIFGISLISLLPLNSDSARRSGGVLAYKALPAMIHIDQWFTSRLRQDYGFVSKIQGKILTLAPAPVIENAGQIYSEFATGPFAWRGARLISAEDRKRYLLTVPEDLEALLAKDPPAAILTGVEDEDLEVPLVAYAKEHQFKATKVSKRRTLWTPRASM